jgi:hypothetical protein
VLDDFSSHYSLGAKVQNVQRGVDETDVPRDDETS